MADLIDRQALLEWFENWSDYDEFSVRYIVGIIKEQPSADAVEVVRCKDCYHYDEESEKCILNNSEFKPTDYCSYGSK